MIKVTIVGWRYTPKDIMAIMIRLTSKLENDGCRLRTGDCPIGGDLACRSGVKHRANIEVYTPFEEIPQLGYDLVDELHGRPSKLTPMGRKLMARNAMQVLGRNCDDPSNLLVCYTEDGCLNHASRTKDTGGTGQAISIADKYGVKILNLSDYSHLELVEQYLIKKIELDTLINK